MRNRISSYPAIIVLVAAMVSLTTTSASLAQSDSNSDKRLERLLQRAPQADANKDGVLTADEARAFVREQLAKYGNRRQPRIQPTHADIKYGEDARHVIDLYLAKSEQPTP